MAIKPKMITNRSSIDDVFECALEWQERARQNHGVTLEFEKCIGYALKHSYASSMKDIAQSMDTLVSLANADIEKYAD